MEKEVRTAEYVDVHVDNGIDAFKAAHKRYDSATHWLVEHSFGIFKTVQQLNILLSFLAALIFGYSLLQLSAFMQSNNASDTPAQSSATIEPARP